jgi:hypothetical protein
MSVDARVRLHCIALPKHNLNKTKLTAREYFWPALVVTAASLRSTHEPFIATMLRLQNPSFVSLKCDRPELNPETG